MGDKYPYVLTPDALGEFLDGIHARGKPDKITHDYLAKVGLKSTNHRKIVPVLRFIGFIDQSNVPTEKYQRFLSKKDAPTVMAQSLRQAYADLFKHYPDANSQTDAVLRDFFAIETGLGPRALAAVVQTFRILAKRADFVPGQTVDGKDDEVDGEGNRNRLLRRQPRDLGIAINVQLQIPAASDPGIYDNLFKALRKYILDLSDD